MGSVLARHMYMHDFELLSRALEKAGFEDATCLSYREGSVPDISLLDNRPEEILFVEAKRPKATVNHNVETFKFGCPPNVD